MAEEITYSIDDIIQGELELEQDVNVILGAASDQNCSYDQGYVYRQPIFSCLTCNESGTSGITRWSMFSLYFSVPREPRSRHESCLYTYP